MAAADNLEPAKVRTYNGFIRLLKWAVPTIGLIALFVIFLIS